MIKRRKNIKDEEERKCIEKERKKSRRNRRGKIRNALCFVLSTWARLDWCNAMFLPLHSVGVKMHSSGRAWWAPYRCCPRKWAAQRRGAGWRLALPNSACGWLPWRPVGCPDGAPITVQSLLLLSCFWHFGRKLLTGCPWHKRLRLNLGSLYAV